MKRLQQMIVLAIAIVVVSCSTKTSSLSLREKAEVPYLKGESKLMIEAKPSADIDDNKWFTNDHCFI